MCFQGVFFERGYGIAACLQFNRLVRRIQSENVSKKLKREYVRDCIFLLMYKKNFTLLDKYIKFFNTIQEGICDDYSSLVDDVDGLLSDIKEELSAREQKDIIFYWIDSIDYYEKVKYPYVQSIEDKCLCLENMYTVTGFTSPTYKALFYQLMEVSDAGCLRDTRRMESRVFRTLEDAGYDVKIVSGYMKKDRRYWTNINLGACSMSGEVLWETTKNVLESAKPVFCLAHLFPETHSPNMCFDLEGVIGDFSYSSERSMLEQSDLLKLYDALLGGTNASKIYMSDHGRVEQTSRHHVFFDIYNKNITPGKFYEMTSLLDFYKMIEDLVKDGTIHTERLARDFAPIESLSYYSRNNVESILFQGEPFSILSVGYTGIATKDMLYLKLSTGVEYLRKKSGHMMYPYFVNCPMNVPDKTNLSFFRKNTNDYPLELHESDNKFKYTRYLFRALELIDLKQKELLQLKKIVNNWFLEQEDNSVIIRPGGHSTYELLHLLESGVSRKIAGIADNNANCECADIGYPIMSVGEMMQRQNAVIFIPSFLFREEIKGEFKGKGKKDLLAVNMYDLLEENGMRFTSDVFVQYRQPKVTDEIRKKIHYEE